MQYWYNQQIESQKQSIEKLEKLQKIEYVI